jgi:trans-2,3-dihydro-3-hydroxyanthranilate isomerase
MRELRYVVVDVFSHQPLTGNALAVFTDARGLDPDTMQALARELNLSETTFVLPPERGGTARVRIFTPRKEVPFAGHPTLGTGIVLGARLGAEQIVLELGVGEVPVALTREHSGVTSGWFTRRAPALVPFEETQPLRLALGVELTVTPIVVYSNGMRHAIVHLRSAAEVAALQPDLSALARLPVDTIDVFSCDGVSAKLRVFAPAHGVPEDPATGSAAAPLLCHLLKHAGFAAHETLTISQGAELRRPARLQVRLSPATAGEVALIDVGGAGVEVAEGTFRLPNAKTASRQRARG